MRIHRTARRFAIPHHAVLLPVCFMACAPDRQDSIGSLEDWWTCPSSFERTNDVPPADVLARLASFGEVWAGTWHLTQDGAEPVSVPVQVMFDWDAATRLGQVVPDGEGCGGIVSAVTAPTSIQFQDLDLAHSIDLRVFSGEASGLRETTGDDWSDGVLELGFGAGAAGDVAHDLYVDLFGAEPPDPISDVDIFADALRGGRATVGFSLDGPASVDALVGTSDLIPVTQ